MYNYYWDALSNFKCWYILLNSLLHDMQWFCDCVFGTEYRIMSFCLYTLRPNGSLWSDNTCVFTRFHSVKNANTQLIWSSVSTLKFLTFYEHLNFKHYPAQNPTSISLHDMQWFCDCVFGTEYRIMSFCLYTLRPNGSLLKVCISISKARIFVIKSADFHSSKTRIIFVFTFNLPTSSVCQSLTLYIYQLFIAQWQPTPITAKIFPVH
jgi:hypothetical protein